MYLHSFSKNGKASKTNIPNINKTPIIKSILNISSIIGITI